jgi:hypothetical protein
MRNESALKVIHKESAFVENDEANCEDRILADSLFVVQAREKRLPECHGQ